MKIYKDGELITELSNKPKNLDCGCRGGVVTIVVGDKDIKLATYQTQARASEVMQTLCEAYLTDEEEFNLPNE